MLSGSSGINCGAALQYFALVICRGLRVQTGVQRGIKGNGFIALLQPQKMKMSLTPTAGCHNEKHNSR